MKQLTETINPHPELRSDLSQAWERLLFAGHQPSLPARPKTVTSPSGRGRRGAAGEDIQNTNSSVHTYRSEQFTTLAFALSRRESALSIYLMRI